VPSTDLSRPRTPRWQQHIARRYDNPRAPLARQTFFLQPHLAWDWVAKPRLKEVYADTGFISFGPYLNASCTGDGSEKDSHGMSFPRISQIYAMFNGDLCPSTGFTVSVFSSLNLSSLYHHP
jgi:hypothetical protein